MRNGQLFERAQSAPRIDGNESSSLLPTPNASVAQDGEQFETWETHRQTALAKHTNGNGIGMPLTIAVQLLPTPTASEATGAGHAAQGGRNLRTELLPTPRAQHGEPRNQNCWQRPLDEPQNLENALARLPGAFTPPPSAAGSRQSAGPRHYQQSLLEMETPD
jgi:hypothetical protein